MTVILLDDRLKYKKYLDGMREAKLYPALTFEEWLKYQKAA